MNDADLVVVGAGIVALGAVRELLARRPGLRVVLLERESQVARHQTGSNSGVIHAGIYYRPGSLKAQLCVEGARLMYTYCDDRGIATERCGKVIVARDARELSRLDELEARGRANRVLGLRRIDAEGLRELEPHAAGVEALHSPATGIVDYSAVARSLADDVRAAGADLRLGVTVTRIGRDDGRVEARWENGGVRARRGLVCAGGWTDRLARAAGAPADPRIVPFRGAYLRLAPPARRLVRAMIYPVPDPALPFLGVHLTKRIDGEVWLGPSALMVAAPDAYRLHRVEARSVRDTLAWPGTWRMIRRHWRPGVDELRMAFSRGAFVAAAQTYVPELRAEDVQPGRGPSGVRAQALGRDGALVDDFILNDIDGVQYVRNAPSPAATSSLALARRLADQLESALA